MRISNLLFVFGTYCTFVTAEKVRYDNHQVYRIHVDNESQLHLLEKLQQFSEHFKFWKYPNSIGKDVDVMVPGDKVELLNRISRNYGLRSDVIIEDVQKLIDEEQQPFNAETESGFGWKRYHKLEEIYRWLDQIEDEFPEYVTPFNIGKSYHNQDIRGIKISYKSGNPGVFIEANIHAREWIASATATYVINQLLTSTDPKVRNIAENIDWYIIPVLNVDGFTYSHEVDRLWRKTRQPSENSSCIGVDINRNFNTFWASNGGASRNPCDETFAGVQPFSEQETIVLAQYVAQLKDKISIYIAYHTYGQLLLSPYGHTSKEFPANYDDMQSIAAAAVEGIRRRYGTSYRHGSTASVLYLASGTSPDWMYNYLKIPLAYTFEFRDKGAHGFVLPPEQILPNAEEALDGLLALVEKAQEKGYLK